MSKSWTRNSDKDISGYLNLTKKMVLFGDKFELKAGGLYRNKQRDNFYNAYSLNPTLNEVYTNINSALFIFNTFHGAESCYDLSMADANHHGYGVFCYR